MQIYRRKLRTDQIKALFTLADFWPDSAKLSEMKDQLALGAIADFHKLKHWSLIEKDESKPVGYYKISNIGLQFITGKIRIPQFVWVYRDNRVPRPEEDKTVNNMLSISEIGYSPINKEIALQDSIPFSWE